MSESRVSDFTPGDRVVITDALGKEHPAVADSVVEGTHHGGRKVHDFPVVWVKIDGKRGRVPWPVEDVRSLCICDEDGISVGRCPSCDIPPPRRAARR